MRAWLHVPGDWRRPHHDASYQLYWSDAAEFGQLHPRPTPDELGASYDVRDYYTHENAPESVRALSPLQRICHHLAWRLDSGEEFSAQSVRGLLGGRDGDCLDIGCGDGSLLNELRALGHRTTGIEPDPEARRVAAAKGLAVLDGTAELLPAGLGGRMFDAITMMHVLEHTLDPCAALENVRGLLDPDGVLIVEVPSNRCVGLRMSGATWAWLDVPRHLNFFTQRSLHALLRATGFAPVSTAYRGLTRQFGGTWIDTERRIAAAFSKDSATRYRSADRVALLARTLLSARADRFDSVRVVARVAAITMAPSSASSSGP